MIFNAVLANSIIVFFQYIFHFIMKQLKITFILMLLGAVFVNANVMPKRQANVDTGAIPPVFAQDIITAKTNAGEALRLAKIQQVYEGAFDGIGIGAPSGSGAELYETYKDNETGVAYQWNGTSWVVLAGSERRVGVDFFGVVRPVLNSGTGQYEWRFIEDSAHRKKGFTGIETIPNGFRVYYANVGKVGELKANVDESYALSGVFAGASVGLTSADFVVYAHADINVYLSWNGTAWTRTSSGSFLNPAVSVSGAGDLTVAHPGQNNPYGISVLRRTGCPEPRVGSMGITSKVLSFYDDTGAKVNTPTTAWQLVVSIKGPFVLTPQEIAALMPGGNLWLSGSY